MSNNHDHHEHDHHEGHNHVHTNNKKALILSFALITGYMFVELIGGFITNSLALLSDAGHMFSDSVALGLSLFALLIGTKTATVSKSYGYKRFEILAALLNGVALVVISIFICKEAVERFSSPPQIMGKGMMIISVIGLLVNLVVAWVLHSKGSTEENLNVRSAFLHVLGDLLGSVGAIVAALLIMLFGWYIADPIASIVVSALVLYSGWRVIKESVNILMEGTPQNIDTLQVIAVLKQIEGVSEVHDLHIWMITPEYSLMTVHLRVTPHSDRDLVVEKARLAVFEKFGIRHTTIQTEGRELCAMNEVCN